MLARDSHHAIAYTLAVVLLAAGCDGAHDPVPNGQTRWLHACNTDRECGSLSCTCGVCSTTCEHEDSCTSKLGYGATCQVAVLASASLTCSDARARGRICLAECDADKDCTARDPQLACVAGICSLRGKPGDGGAPIAVDSGSRGIDSGSRVIDSGSREIGDTRVGHVEDSGADGAPPPPALDAGSTHVDGACPSDLPGPKLVSVPTPDGGSYCIDATEVTSGDYARFLAALSQEPVAPMQPPVCEWNTSFAATASTTEALPVVGVDWCDAVAFCTWAGKRLCGKIGGGPVEYTHYALARESQWYNACSAGGTKTYPYGDSYRGSTCNGYERGAGGVVAVAEMAACEGGYPGLFDMSGNVDEWEDSCAAATGADDQCQFRSGSYNDSLPNARLNCDWAANETGWFGTRASSGPNLGFRCCRD